jgi:hypothetical protein
MANSKSDLAVAACILIVSIVIEANAETSAPNPRKDNYVSFASEIDNIRWEKVEGGIAAELVDQIVSNSKTNLSKIHNWSGQATEVWEGQARTFVDNPTGDRQVTATLHITRQHTFLVNRDEEWTATRYVRDPKGSNDDVSSNVKTLVMPDDCLVYTKEHRWSYGSREVIGRLPTSPGRQARPAPILREELPGKKENAYMSSPIDPMAMFQPGSGMYVHDEMQLFPDALRQSTGPMPIVISRGSKGKDAEPQFVRIEISVPGVSQITFIHDILRQYQIIYTSSTKPGSAIEGQGEPQIQVEIGWEYEAHGDVLLPIRVQQRSRETRRTVTFSNSVINDDSFPKTVDWTWCQPSDGTYIVSPDTTQVHVVKDGQSELFEDAAMKNDPLRDSSRSYRIAAICINVVAIAILAFLWLRKSITRKRAGAE